MTTWAHTKQSTLYHQVAFPSGPKIHEETAACGLRARFWPRIGVRMEDRQ